MKILVTNDDGVEAPGLAHLARALVDVGYEVLIAAPKREASGAGAGVGPIHMMTKGIEFDEVKLPGLEDVPTFGVDALPALIVLVNCLGVFGPPPDLIVAGINAGRNVGRAVLHSGTVGAVLTGTHFGKSGLAMSMQSGPFAAFEASGRGRIHFETAAALAVALLPNIIAAPSRTVINCNVPNLPIVALKGVRWAGLSRAGLIRSAALEESVGPAAVDGPAPVDGNAGLRTRPGARMRLETGIAAPLADDETDEAMTTRGYATITPLASVAEDLRPAARETMETLLVATATFAATTAATGIDSANDAISAAAGL